MACGLQVHENRLQCSQLQEVKQPVDMAVLPNNAIVLQQQPATAPPDGPVYSLSFANADKRYTAAGAAFGQVLQKAGEFGQSGLEDVPVCGLRGM